MASNGSEDEDFAHVQAKELFGKETWIDAGYCEMLLGQKYVVDIVEGDVRAY